MGGSTQFFTGIIMNDGRCAMAGFNNNNQQSNGQPPNVSLGFNFTSNTNTETELNNVTCVSLGASHSGVVFNNGNVAMNGDNTYGQLGVGPNNLVPVSANTQLMLNTNGVTILSNASTVSCGNGFTLVLLKNGNVLSCGLNTYGQLGVNNNVNYSVTQYVIDNTQTTNLANIKAISTGDSFSAFLTNNGTVLTCGSNNYGQLGNGNFGVNQPYPNYVVDVNQNPITGVIAISCGYEHMAMLLNTGNVLVCGNNSNGQCGVLPYATYFYRPALVVSSSIPDKYGGGFKYIDVTNIKSVSCGNLNTYFITNNGLLLGTGDNTYGQLSTLNYKAHELEKLIAKNLSELIEYKI
jgi:alpha-tubulin suppressor-like RCC1 family protein